MVAVGLATTEFPVLLLNDPEGDHVYVAAPVAESVALLPEQIVVEEPVTDTTGDGVTATVIDAVSLQLPLEPIIVYVVLAVGEAVTDEPVEALRPDAGDQVNVPAPLALRVALVPEQIVSFDEVTATEGIGVTVMVIVCISVQLPLAPVTE